LPKRGQAFGQGELFQGEQGEPVDQAQINQPSPENKHSQLERFRQTARARGCDEEKARFDAALATIATHKHSFSKKKKSQSAPDGKRK
jgi:hypothetical protein